MQKLLYYIFHGILRREKKDCLAFVSNTKGSIWKDTLPQFSRQPHKTSLSLQIGELLVLFFSDNCGIPILLELAIAIKNYNTFYADLTGYDVIHPCVLRENTVKTVARGMPGISSPTHLTRKMVPTLQGE